MGNWVLGYLGLAWYRGGGVGVQASGYERGFRLLWLRVRGFRVL